MEKFGTCTSSFSGTPPPPPSEKYTTPTLFTQFIIMIHILNCSCGESFYPQVSRVVREGKDMSLDSGESRVKYNIENMQLRLIGPEKEYRRRSFRMYKICNLKS
jgi:hypothetical protein